MRLTSLLLAATAVVVVSVPCARAQDAFETESGNLYQGKVLSNDGTSVEIQTTDGATMKLPLATLTAATQYRLRASTTGADGKSQLELADWCVDKTLYPEAKATYRKALAADATMSEEINAHMVIARTKAANEVLARAKRLQASKQGPEARRLLSTLVQELPLEEASKEAAQILAAETSQREQEMLTKRAPKAAAKPDDDPNAPRRDNGEPYSEATRTLFQPIIDSYKKMLDATQKGLEQGGTGGTKEFEKALDEGEKIRKTADKLQSQAANSEEITEALALVDEKLQEAVVDARINLMDTYLLRTSYNDASEVVRQGLAQYPKNERLRQAMNQVTAASSSNSGGGWVIGGRGR